MASTREESIVFFISATSASWMDSDTREGAKRPWHIARAQWRPFRDALWRHDDLAEHASLFQQAKRLPGLLEREPAIDGRLQLSLTHQVEQRVEIFRKP